MRLRQSRSRLDEATVRLGRHLVGKRLGIIDTLRERRCDYEGSRVVDYVTSLTGYGHADDMVHAVYGGGAPSRTHACAAAIGEAIERYQLSRYRPDSLLWARLADMDSAAFNVEALTWFTDTQYRTPGFPFQRPSLETKYAWARGYSPTRDATMFAPASLVYLPYRLRPGEPAPSFAISSGTSCARSYEEAAYRALLELVERDALTICWEHHTPYPPVDESQVARAVDALGNAAPQVSVRAFDLTTDVGIPVILAVVQSRRDRPALAIGVAADLDPIAALVRAAEEAITSWRSSLYICRNDKTPAPELLHRMRDGHSFVDNSLYYSFQAHVHHFDFLLCSDLPARSMATSERQESPLNTCIQLLKDSCQEVVLFDLTQSDIESVGLHVVRAVSPTLVRQTIGFAARHLANKRIVEVPKRLQHVTHSRSLDDILNDQHPSP